MEASLSPVLVALITAIATIISAILSAVITRNGLNFWRAKRIYKLTGSGSDLRSLSWRGDVYEHASPFKYSLKSGTLEITEKRSKLVANISVYRQDGSDVADGVLNASGINEGGVAHMSYQITDSHSNQHWQGVLLLRISKLGEINGLWISDSDAEAGTCTFGSLLLERR